MRAPVPATASTQARVAVAIPDRWHTRFSAVRSAVSRPRTGARTASATSPAARTSPSARGREHGVAVGAEHRVEHRAGGGQPSEHAGRAGGELRDRDGVGGHGGRGRRVRPVAQVLGQRGRDDAAEVVGVGRAHHSGLRRSAPAAAGCRAPAAPPPGRSHRSPPRSQQGDTPPTESQQGDIPPMPGWRSARRQGPRAAPGTAPSAARVMPRPTRRARRRPGGPPRPGAPRCWCAATRRRGRGSRCGHGSPGSRCACPRRRAPPGRAA